MAKRPQIIILNGDMAGKRFDVPAGGLRLGRSSSNDIHVPDEELSRNHCLFEQDGLDGIRVIDLASANGTFVNGDALGADARVLSVGDVIEAGQTALKIVEEGAPDALATPPRQQQPPQPQQHSPDGRDRGGGGASPFSKTVDLGLDGGARGADIVADATPPEATKRNIRVNILWGVVALLVASAIALMILMPSPDDDASVVTPGGRRLAEEAKAAPAVTELRYEKINADSSHIFRFFLNIDAAGVMSVVCDDVPGEMRHVEKKKQLTPEEMERVSRIFASDGWRELDRSYAGSSSLDENRLESYRICAMGSGGLKEVSVENTIEPPAFRVVREALEAFSRNELGIWVLQYSREELLKLVKASEDLGDLKWADRDVQYGNTAAAVAAYREACFYLETLEPKPGDFRALHEKLENAEAELESRYKEQRFLADRAINLGDWAKAKEELTILLQIVTDQEDPRHTEAKAKLVDVEKRLSKKKGK